MKIKLGIFDSGIGGFTVLKSLLSKRQGVDVLYLADTKRNPYGEKNRKEIRLIANEISNWFKGKDLDALLIACNTTNACALDILRKELAVPSFDLINSVAMDITSDRVAVLATSSTVNSLSYKKIIESYVENVEVFQQACPEFVPEIEKIPIDSERINLLSEIYLKPILDKNIKEIILGCSHYPLIYEILKNKLPKNIKIIDPSIAMINNLNNYFPKSGNPSYQGDSFDNVQFYATSNVEEFSLKVKNWLGISKEINLVSLRTDT